jgi:hypothetical protein
MNSRQRRKKRRQKIKEDNESRRKTSPPKINIGDISKMMILGGVAGAAMSIFNNWLGNLKTNYTPEELEKIRKQEKSEKPKEKEPEKKIARRKLELED